MGASAGTRETTSHERNRDVHDRQQSADIQHHDGLHAVQGPDRGNHEHSEHFSKARDGREQGADDVGEGGVCGL